MHMSFKNEVYPTLKERKNTHIAEYAPLPTLCCAHKGVHYKLINRKVKRWGSTMHWHISSSSPPHIFLPTSLMSALLKTYQSIQNLNYVRFLGENVKAAFRRILFVSTYMYTTSKIRRLDCFNVTLPLLTPPPSLVSLLFCSCLFVSLLTRCYELCCMLRVCIKK